MASPSTADVSESFAHLTLDNTDKLSSTDEISVHSLPDIQAFLELARQHDKDAQTRSSGNDPGFEDAAISSHLTPLVRNESLMQRRNILLDAINENTQDHKQDSNKMDGAELFKTIQPFIDQYMAQFSGVLMMPGARQVLHEPDLDLDLKAEDTFDKIPHRSIESNRTTSPSTSPPQSSDSHLTDSRGTFVEEDFCKPIPPIVASNTSLNQSGNLGTDSTQENPDSAWLSNNQRQGASKVDLNRDTEAPQVDLPDLTSHEIDLGPLNPRANEQTIVKLLLELDQYKQENAELVNELQFLRSQLKNTNTKTGKTTDDKHENYSHNTSENILEKGNKHVCVMEDKSTPIKLSQDPVPKTSIDETSIPGEFRPYYQRLQLAKVDALTSAEKSNLIKSIMLSLLVSDFDHLPSVMPQVGSYLRMTSKFLDDLHSRLYRNNDVGPLRYLRDYDLHTSDGLQECLDGMFNIII